MTRLHLVSLESLIYTQLLILVRRRRKGRCESDPRETAAQNEPDNSRDRRTMI